MALSPREAAVADQEEKASMVEFWFHGELLTSSLVHTGTALEREMLLNFCERTGGSPFVPLEDLKNLSRTLRAPQPPESSWRRLNGWSKDIEPKWHHEFLCCYHGVKLSDTGRCMSLNLSSNGLVNVLPQRMLRELEDLEELDLSDNDLRGSGGGGMLTDDVIARFPRLTRLSLSDNPRLGGRIPATLATTARNLEVLQLHNCGLEGVIPTGLLSQLPQLKSFLVHDNRLTGPSPLTLFSGDEVMDEEQEGSGLNMALVTSLKGGVAARAVAGTHATRGSAISSGRRDQQATSNHSQALARHRSLVRISCHDNALTGPLGVLSVKLKLRLKHLTLAANKFTGTLDRVLERWQHSSDQRVALTTLTLDHNALSGPLPRALSCCRHSLKVLRLGHNRLTGPVDPLLLGQLTVLETLQLNHNRFTGRIPEALTSMRSTLKDFALSHNRITGALPCEALGLMSELQVLNLQQNELTGHITPSLFKRTSNLRELSLGANNLSGPMPLAALATFQTGKRPHSRIRRVDFQPNPRMIQPSEAQLAALRRALPESNLSTAWRSYTF